MNVRYFVAGAGVTGGGHVGTQVVERKRMCVWGGRRGVGETEMICWTISFVQLCKEAERERFEELRKRRRRRGRRRRSTEMRTG